jgi:hypothetical protein
MTLRFECPACHHEQSQGGKCEKCGVDFLKYISAVVAVKKDEADAIHDKFARRSSILTQAFWVPATGGLSLLKLFSRKAKDSSGK